MIIKKPKTNTARLKRKDWPFTVPEVTIVASVICTDLNNDGQVVFAIVHNFQMYALSGILENHGIPSLKESGIWREKPTGYKDGLMNIELEQFFTNITELHRELSEKSE